MKLTLLSKQEYTTITLPEKCAGQYWVRGKNAVGKMVDVVAVEAVRSHETNGATGWVLKSNRRFKVTDKVGDVAPNVPIKPLELYTIQSVDKNLKFVLYAEPLSDDRKQYICYEAINGTATLKIGRNEKNNVAYANSFVSSNHAELAILPNEIRIRDLGSANNTYVNGRAVEYKVLGVGDVVYILGLQIVVTNRCIFLNNPDGNVIVNCDELREYYAPPVMAETAKGTDFDDDFEDISDEYYYRAPRFKQDVEIFQLKIDDPPANQGKEDVPMIMMLGPAMTMGIASIATGAFAISDAIGRGDIRAALPAIVMSGSMLLGTLLWPIITKAYQKKLNQQKEARRQVTYRKYLEQMEALIANETERQEQLLRDNDVDMAAIVNKIQASNCQIWERTPKHADFLKLRLGVGVLPFNADIQYTARKFIIDDDNLLEAMYQFGEKKRWLHNVPICLPLVERYVSGVYAEKNRIITYAKHLIVQMVALHSYDELKIALIYDESDEGAFSFARWLPHLMSNDRANRYIATNADEAKELSATLDTIIEYRKALINGNGEPHFVIICLDKELSTKTECIRRIQESKGDLKFSVLSMFERLEDLPKECSAVISLDNDSVGNLTFINDVSEAPVEFAKDPLQLIDFNQVVNTFANTYVDMSGSLFSLPKVYTFFELLDVGRIEHLNLLSNWALSDPTRSLAAFVGVDRYGEPFKLDLHEKAHGPHGLVAGMTGSGKSEFIIAYILAMAASFHPYEVAFILIDYKGGGMAKSFENIPHTAGVITNLDGSAITRSLASMRSELHRRERIFRDTSQQHNVSNIDIYKYQKLFRDGKVDEPLPHLIIVSDEFAELKKEQPEFMTELTSTARVGRSLGVHLILATQKPGGVVDDQIRSNSRFRICLKVQDAGDSREMLGCPEAAALVDTGRFYLQVGNNEIFEIGQSAWAGAPYYPATKVVKDRDDAITIISTSGRIIAEDNTDRFANIKDPPKQLDVVTSYISKVCEDEHIKWWKMWLDPIPATIYVYDLAEKYNVKKSDKFILNPIVGEYDDPSHQTQDILQVPITEDGNTVIYGAAGNGKEMFAEAICYSLLKNHSPKEVNIYIMDFGAEMLSAFSRAPHVGDVVFSREEEKVYNLIKMLLDKLEVRRKMLSQFGGDLLQYNRQTDKPEPSIIVVINNYGIFSDLYEHMYDDIVYLTSEGLKYGIYFVLTCTGISDVRYNMMQNFKNIYCLQLNNIDDYMSVVGRTGGVLPEKHKGRGLVRKGADNLFEFQTARITAKNPHYSFIRTFSEELAGTYTGIAAASIPTLPEIVTGQFLLPHIAKGGLSCVPIGVEKETLNIAYYDFSKSCVHLLLSTDREWQGFADALGEFIANGVGIKTILFDPSGVSQAKSSEKLQIVSCFDDSITAIEGLSDAVLVRDKEYGGYGSGDNSAQVEPVFIIIRSLSELKTMLESYIHDEGATDITKPYDLLCQAMGKCKKGFNIHFMIAESHNALAQFTSESWYFSNVNSSSGIWIGSGISSQYQLKLSRLPQNCMVELESDFGYAIANSSAVQVKFLMEAGK